MARGEQLKLPEWSELLELSQRERALASELEQVRAQLHEQAREMKNSGQASVAEIAERLDRNRQRVNGWMREKPLRPVMPENDGENF